MTSQRPDQVTKSGHDDRWWMRPSGLAIISLAVILIFGTAALVLGLKVDPQDDANYAITASAVAVAALNVLFTLWLLRTAQKQLIHMRQQAREQEEISLNQLRQLQESHEAERAEARQQLDSLRKQLELAQKSHAAEREEARNSLQVSRDATEEALKARLDQLAPKVSLAIDKSTSTLFLKERIQAEEVGTSKDIGDPNDLVGRANCWLELVVRFTLRNWGTEPVAITLPSPWVDQRQGLLLPDESWKLAHTFTISTRNLREIAEFGLRMNLDKPHWTFAVLADDMGGQVHDYLTWRVHPRPLKLEHGRIALNPDHAKGFLQYGYRQRRYHVLDQQALAAGNVLDGPDLN